VAMCRGTHFSGGLRCLTLRYNLPLSVWVDPHAEHVFLLLRKDIYRDAIDMSAIGRKVDLCSNVG